MLVRIGMATAFALLATLGVALGLVVQPSTQPAAPLSAQPRAHSGGLRALDGEWIYVEDVTEGRALEQMGPPMASKFSMRIEDEAGAKAGGGDDVGGGGAVVLNGHGSGHKDVRIALDGSIAEIVEPKTISRYRGSWKDGTFEYVVEFEREAGTASERSIRSIRRSFTPTAEGAGGGAGGPGLVVRVVVDPPIVTESVARYQHAEDIAMPAPAKARIADIGWIAGDWVGSRPETGSSVEERWSPPKGGAMLATSRSVNTSGKMFAFEYLRIVERDGGLVYIAQPGGKAATEFVLTELGAHRAVFENPRHDFPKRIVYERGADAGAAGAGGEGEAKSGTLTTTIGYIKGGTPRRVEFTPEGR